MLHRRSQGVANDRLRLYFEHLAPIKVNLPSSDTQKRVAKTLGAIDELIRRSDDELQALLATRTALSRDLLAGDTPIPPQLLNGSAQVWSERSSA
jgi:restriction endonuclease S subunit